ncbi:MAG: DEAD/DEAH box helicase family protein [Bacteroidetes bacterium]|nr:DEAD/DEAH box helicase family protein [Bacteroidota bacterium]
MVEFDINKFKGQKNDRYAKHLASLKKSGKETTSIEKAVSDALKNIEDGKTRSFVIYGEPQSGKTEMMIGLTAKLLDAGNKIVIHLLNDSVDLLNQNLRRFKKSGLSPSPKHFKEIIDPEVKLKDGEFVVFCKKNFSDLQKLISKLGNIKGRVIIDDEADYASPNSKVNKGQKTKINALIETLLENEGVYIGVTATPARLDLNNTFENDHEKWVDFPPHKNYTGQDAFFPIDSNDPGFNYKLTFLSDSEDNPKYIKEALFRFFINVAYLNLKNATVEQNYSILIHTSGKKIDHKSDKSVVEVLLSELADQESKRFENHIKLIYTLVAKIYPGEEEKLTGYIVTNRSKASIVLLNSDRSNDNLEDAANPISLFTIVIGGNIVSRGVTFNNLLSMFFTRDVRQKIQQDTYIQRARMFGSRGDYLKYFELTIPESLYTDWHRCFVFHRLAITAIREGKGAPIWLSDSRIMPTALSSIDRGTVSFDRGEMAFSIFDFDCELAQEYNDIVESPTDSFSKLNEIKKLLGEGALPEYLQQYILNTSFKGTKSIAIHVASSIANYKDDPGTNKDKIERVQGFFGTTQMQKKKFPDATHHFKVFFNAKGRGRLYYKFDGSIQFIKNLKSSIEKKNHD